MRKIENNNNNNFILMGQEKERPLWRATNWQVQPWLKLQCQKDPIIYLEDILLTLVKILLGIINNINLIGMVIP